MKAWLLETVVDGRPAFYKGKHLHSSLPEYTFDANEAWQFSSKDAAESSDAMRSPWHKYIATEHEWVK